MPKVLIAIDGSEYANNALADAARLFGEAAEYVLLSVVPPWSPGVALGANEELDLPGGSVSTSSVHATASTGMPFSPTPQSVEATVEGLYNHYRRAQAQAEAMAGITAEHLIEEAKPRKRRIGKAICETAEEHGADLIVVGSHGSSHAGEALLGSVSQYVVHNAHCPVLVCRDND